MWNGSQNFRYIQDHAQRYDDIDATYENNVDKNYKKSTFVYIVIAFKHVTRANDYM